MSATANLASCSGLFSHLPLTLKSKMLIFVFNSMPKRYPSWQCANIRTRCSKVRALYFIYCFIDSSLGSFSDHGKRSSTGTLFIFSSAYSKYLSTTKAFAFAVWTIVNILPEIEAPFSVLANKTFLLIISEFSEE